MFQISEDKNWLQDFESKIFPHSAIHDKASYFRNSKKVLHVLLDMLMLVTFFMSGIDILLLVQIYRNFFFASVH